MIDDNLKFFDDKNISAKKILRKNYFSEKMMGQLFKNDSVVSNGKIVKPNSKIKPNDGIEIIIRDEISNYESIDLGLKVDYEDQDIIVVTKPAGICMHSYNHEINLNNGISYLFDQRELKRKIRFINRLDMNTSGLVMVAKNPFVQNFLNREEIKKSFCRSYIAIVEGKFNEKKGILRYALAKGKDEIKYEIKDSGVNCEMEYEVMKEYESHSMLEVNLITGRTHQIRAILSGIGHPLIGDELYGGSMEKIQRQCLHAYELSFMSMRDMSIRDVISEIPAEIQQLKGL
ncbi:MAG: RluA family pseudouridine synthase [Tissierellia bacterium]|nr:RluA family pseudouridine synthase [Tissierellia bacterium]